MRRPNIHLIRILEGYGRENGEDEIVKERTAKKFLGLLKDVTSQNEKSKKSMG